MANRQWEKQGVGGYGCMFTENDLNSIKYYNAIVLINEGIGSIKKNKNKK